MKLAVSKNIETLIPYPPGKPIEELEREYGITGSIKMASNENCLGPSAKAVTAIHNSLNNLHRYPDGSCHYLASRLADYLKVKPQELVFGNGSNEIIDLLISTFMAPGQEVITSHPTFLVYQKMVQARGGVNKVLPLKEMCHDLTAILDEITDQTKLIFLDNPNNPTGTIFSEQEFALFLEKVPNHIIVVVDEAYVDFVEPKHRLNTIAYLKHNTPVVALRTFSKAYGLAGLRIGYGIMHRKIADYLHKVRQPFNVNYPAQVGAFAAIDDKKHYQKTMTMTRDGLIWLSEEVKKLGLSPFPSHTNFFLIDIKGDSRKLYKQMLKKGVIIRAMDSYGYENYIRVTVGLAADNLRFINTLAETLPNLKT